MTVGCKVSQKWSWIISVSFICRSPGSFSSKLLNELMRGLEPSTSWLQMVFSRPPCPHVASHSAEQRLTDTFANTRGVVHFHKWRHVISNHRANCSLCMCERNHIYIPNIQIAVAQSYKELLNSDNENRRSSRRGPSYHSNITSQRNYPLYEGGLSTSQLATSSHISKENICRSSQEALMCHTKAEGHMNKVPKLFDSWKSRSLETFMKTNTAFSLHFFTVQHVNIQPPSSSDTTSTHTVFSCSDRLIESNVVHLRNFKGTVHPQNLYPSSSL